jgi:ABC-type polysaccharide/polyol phosphate export permease
MSEFFTIATLATFAGAALATAIVTQFIKKALAKIPTQIVSYIIALAILLIVTAALGAEDWTDWVLAPLNAVLVSIAANGGYAGVERCLYGKKD